MILAGGFGTRIRGVDDSVPKPLIQIAGKPVLFRQIELLKKFGVDEIIVVAGHMGAVLKERTLSAFPDGVTVLIEDTPLGSGGCLSLVRHLIGEHTLVLSGDLVLDMALDRLINFHLQSKARITLTVHPNSHPRDSDLVEMLDETFVRDLLLRPHPSDLKYHNLVNASVAVCHKSVWDFIPDDQKLNFEKDVVRAVIKNGGRVAAYNTSEYIRDMGTPDRWRSVADDIQNGTVEARSLRNKQRAIFFDRDGVLNQYRRFIVSPSELALEEGAVEAVKRVNRSGMLAIVATNQPQIARGMCTFEGLDSIHRELETLLGNEGAKLDGIYICPHHPDSGFQGERIDFKIKCNCRKPMPGLIEQAANHFNIDIQNSVMIGDSSSDIKMANDLGMRSVLVQTGLGGKDSKFPFDPTYVAANVFEAVKCVI